MTRRWVPIAIAITLGAALAATLPVLPAVSQESPPPPVVEIEDTATLAARGAAVLVTVTVTCPAGEEAYLQVGVSQRRGSRAANGFGYVDTLVCTGEPQTVTVPVLASNATFKKGVAFATAQLFVCGRFFCGSVTDAEEITLVEANGAAVAA